MTSEDPRRVALAEAMEARAALGADPPAEVTIKADCEQDARMVGPTVRFIVAAHNALPAAVELIEELTRREKQMEGRIERSNLVISPNGQMLMPKRGDWTIASDLLDRAEKAEATIAEQAKEIERLRAPIRCACCGGSMCFPSICAECEEGL